MPDLVDIKTAAAMLGVTTKSVRNYIAAGHLPAYRIAGHLLRVSVADIAAMLQPV